MRRTEQPILSPEKLHTLRVQARLTRRAVADKLGVSTPVVERWEEGVNHEVLTLGMATRLAVILGVPLASLLVGEPLAASPTVGAGTENDACKLEALLAGTDVRVHVDDVARGLGWKSKRLLAATRFLADRLEGTGQRLLHDGGHLALHPRTDKVSSDEQRQVHRGSLSEAGLNLASAATLYEVMRGELRVAANTGKGNSFAVITGLARSGLIEPHGVRWELAGDVSFSLYLDRNPQ